MRDLEDNKKVIEELHSTLRLDMAKQLSLGVITNIRLEESEHKKEFEFPDGWFSRLYHRANEYDVFGIRCKKGCKYPEHIYPNHNIQLVLVSGALKVSVENLGEITMHSQDTLKIDKGNKHEITPLSDSYLLLTSNPSIK